MCAIVTLGTDLVTTAFLLWQPASLDPGPHSITDPASWQSGHIEWLYWVIFWICFAAFVLVIAAFARSTAANTIRLPEPAPIMEDKEGDARAKWFVGAAVGITVLSLFVVLVLSLSIGKRVGGLNSKNPITIQVTGHQWWWEVTYSNPEPDLTVTTANEIHVPVGKPIVILTNSNDVIHSFWAPNITGKRDLLPGNSTAYWFKVDNPGRYHGQCAEFCGMQHAHMGFEVVAESEAEFEAWQNQQLQPAAAPASADIERGRQVFLTHACVMCHTIRGTGAGSRFGPDLTHVGSRRMLAAETLPNTRGALAGWILDPQRIKPGNRMPPNTMEPDDLQALITYLESLK
jgi:cytochrome c oxidase subunit II